MHNSSDSYSSSDDDDDSSGKSHIITAEELMRRKRKNGFGRSQSSAALTIQSNSLNEGDLDDEIKRLEAELEDSSDSSDDDSSSSSDRCDSDDDESMNRRKNEGKEATDQSSSKDAVICLSACASETIEPLDETLLPACKSKKLKIDRDDEHQNAREKKSDSVRNGLRDVVKEVLAGYQPRSSERIPFYCRVCAVQSKDESDFLLHKQSEFHKTAVQVEKKATYCKLCRKQLTSLVQMQEHLDSRPHKERLNSMKARQQGLTGRRYGRNGGAMGRGNRFTQNHRGRGPRV